LRDDVFKSRNARQKFDSDGQQRPLNLWTMVRAGLEVAEATLILSTPWRSRWAVAVPVTLF
jgi:hypothetical protein